MASCAHCGVPIRNAFSLETKEGELQFCCPGCRLAYQLLRDPNINKEERIDAEVDEYRPRLSPKSDGDAEDWEFSLSGMTCRECVPIVKRILDKTGGIDLARVNFLTGRVALNYRPGMVSRELIAKRLKRFGYVVAEGRRSDEEETVSMLIRVSLGLFLAADIMLLSFPEYLGGFAPDEQNLGPWLRLGMLLLTLPIYLWVGRPIFLKAAASLAAMKPDMNFLVTTGAFAALGYSVYSTVTGGPHVYYETAATLPVMIVLGKSLQERAGRKAREALIGLTDIIPRNATVIRGDIEEAAPPETLAVGDIVKVAEGDRVPCDGRLIEGAIMADESALTGESLPRQRSAGEDVKAGALVVTGLARIEVTRPIEDSLLGAVVSSIERADLYRGPRQALLDKIVAFMGPGVLALGIIAGFAAWYGHASVGDSLLRGIAVVLFACPCALSLASPIARSVAIGAAAKMGIAVRDPEALESAARPTALVIDKTGTLTLGAPALDGVMAEPGGDAHENSIVAFAASLDRGSTHPLAQALSRAASQRSLSLQDASDVVDVAGFGRRGTIDGVAFMLGNIRYFESESVAMPRWAAEYSAGLERLGRSVSCLARRDSAEWKVIGVMGFADEVRPEAPGVIAQMIKAGVKPVLATGDNAGAAGPVAEACGIADVRAELSPDGKRDLVVSLKNEGHAVWMAGDGINDAPALAVAALGIAMGQGTKLASEAAHLTLAHGRLESLPELIKLAAALSKVERQNFLWAVGYNAIGLPAAFMGLLKPVFSAFAMIVSSLSVILNSSRLRISSPSPSGIADSPLRRGPVRRGGGGFFFSPSPSEGVEKH